MAGMGGDQGNNKSNIGGSTSRPTPQRGPVVPVPGGNRSPTPRAPTPRSQPLPWPRLRMGLPGVSAFTPYFRTSPQTLDEEEEGSSGSSPASPQRQLEVTNTQTHSLRMGVPGVSAFTPYVRNRAMLTSPPPPPPLDEEGTSRSSPVSSPQTHSLRMGVPGVSAFTPYVRDDRAMLTSPPTSPPPAQAQAQPQPHETAVASGSQIPGSRDNAGGASGGNDEREGDQVVRCSLCDKEFQTGKALFGHMRSHPGRGWKGARPPPAFNASEEFADLIPLIQTPPPVPKTAASIPAPEPEEPAAPTDTGGGVDVVAEEDEKENVGEGLN